MEAGPGVPKMSLALEQPQGCTGPSLGVALKQTHFRTCSFSYRFRGKPESRGCTRESGSQKKAEIMEELKGTNGFLQNSAVSCGFLRKSAGSCGFLRKSAVSCGFLRKSAPPKCCNCQEKQESVKICEKNCEFGSVCPI